MANQAPDSTPKKASQVAWRQAFLANLRNTANVRAAASAAGIHRDLAYKVRRHSAEFRAAWDIAMEDACDILEAAARKRAVAGSDTLLIFLLKSHRPEVYRERIDLRVALEREIDDLARQHPELERAKIVQLADEIARRRGRAS